MANSANTIRAGSLSSTGAATTIANAHDAAHGVAGDQRRLYDLSDRVAELSPEESPFFVYLSKVSKVPTTDPVFRFLENRSKIDWTNRSFTADSALGSLAAGVSGQVAFDSSGAAVDYLIKGMVVAVEVVDGKSHAIVRLDAVTHETTQSTCQVTCLSVGNSSESGYDAIADGDKAQIIGTAFEEGSGSPDVWSKSLDDDFGYTQIFKTACEMTNTAIATNYRGYANEWQRIWNLKLREHKVDIERAMLFGQKGRQNGVQSSAGLVGDIIVRTQAGTPGSLSYSSGNPYFAAAASTSITYDTILSDMEVFFDPARGGSSSKLALAGLPVISYFNKLGANSFQDVSAGDTAGTTNNPAYQYNMNARDGAFGHKVQMINTVHGDLNLIREPLFRGMSGGMLLLADMNQLAYRPLVGNGLNRDTSITTNVQQADEDLRKDMILTEAGLEITIPETHMLYSFTDLN
tara:strand:- start:3417 stop:4802 length:1386 start_codon:yes stop_codon:yes gene_type:complete